MYSPDGRWWWDGRRWVPATPAWPWQARQRRVWPRTAAIAVLVAVAVALAASGPGRSAPRLAAEQHANPYGLVLLDGAGVKHTVTWLGTCPIWSAVNLTQGGLGPKCLAFQATAGRSDGLVPVWTPRFGGGDYDIRLS